MEKVSEKSQQYWKVELNIFELVWSCNKLESSFLLYIHITKASWSSILNFRRQIRTNEACRM
jgi:hypothetical protein